MSINKLFLLAATLFSFGTLMAQGAPKASASPQESKWKVGVGISYRNFESTEFKGTRSTDIVLYENRELGAMYESAYASVHTRGASGDISLGDGLSPAIFGAYELYTKDALSLSLTAGFQYFSLDSSDALRTTTVVETYYKPVRHPEFGSVLGGTSTSVSVSGIDFDMDLYVVDLGIRADYAVIPDLSVYANAGTTLNFSDASVRVNGASASSHDFIVGVFASAGIEYHIWRGISVAADVRYDMAFDEVDVRLAEQELDGFGASLKVVYSF